MFRGALRNAIAPSLQLVAATMFGTRTAQHCMPGGGNVSSSSSSSSSSSTTSLFVPPPLPVVPTLCQALPSSDTGSAPLIVSAIFSGPGYDSDDGEPKPQSFMFAACFLYCTSGAAILSNYSPLQIPHMNLPPTTCRPFHFCPLCWSVGLPLSSSSAVHVRQGNGILIPHLLPWHM